MANKKVNQLTSKPSVLTTDLFPIADPSTGQLFKTTISDLGTAIGSGVSSVNGLVGAVVLDTDDIQELVSPTNKWFTDTRARAALSASSPLTYNSGTGAFGIQVANGSQNGYLSSSDWTTFNSKQAALSGTGFVKISGTTIIYDNSTYLTTSSAASTYLPLSGGSISGLLTVSTLNGLVYADATGQLGTTQGTTDTIAYWSSARTVASLATTTYPSLTELSYVKGVTSAIQTQLNSKQNALTNPVTGTGTSGIVAVFNGTSSITDSTIYANSTRVSIGADVTTTNRFTAVSSTTSAYAIVAQASGAAHGIWSNVLGTGEIFRGQTAGGSYFIINNGGNAFLNGNLNVGDFASTSYRLNVVGTANLTGALSGTSATFKGIVVFDNSASGDANSGIRIVAPIGTTHYNWMIGAQQNVNTGFEITPSTTVGGTTFSTPALTILQTGAATFSSSVTANSYSIAANGTIASNPFWGTLHYKGAGSYADWSLINSAGNGIMWNPTGTLNMVFNGSVGIGTTSPSTYGNLTVVMPNNSNGTGVVIKAINDGGTASQPALTFLNGSSATIAQIIADNGTGYLAFNTGSSSTERMRITSTGFIGVNQTSPYQRFDVSGAIRSGVGISNGASIAKAVGRTLYKVIISSNYDAGGAVRGGEWNVLLSNEGDAVTNTTQIYNYNNQSATFSVSGGNLIVNSLSSGNTICAVYTN